MGRFRKKAAHGTATNVTFDDNNATEPVLGTDLFSKTSANITHKYGVIEGSQTGPTSRAKTSSKRGLREREHKQRLPLDYETAG